MKTILFIDGRNLISKMKFVLDPNRNKNIDFTIYNFKGLFDKVLSKIEVDRRIFYFGGLIIDKRTEKKSIELIEKQRRLKTSLEKQEFEVIYAGRIRGHKENCPKGHNFLSFKEKGVDVRIAVDMIGMAHNKELKLAIIASSDSDLQPAIKELENNSIERIYLGFEDSPNKGLTYTTNRTILIRNSELEEFFGKKLI